MSMRVASPLRRHSNDSWFLIFKCSGSGEGMYDGSTCQKCKGSGVEPVEKDEDDCYE